MDYGGKIQQVLPLGFDAKQWSADGRYLMGVELQDDGHTVTAGEVGLLDTDTGQYTRLTDTPKVIEWGAGWCEAAHRLAYYDELTGDVYIADLEAPQR
jgi:hypothetical protein